MLRYLLVEFGFDEEPVIHGLALDPTVPVEE